MQKPVFRKMAVGQLSSPQQLDHLMQVTTMRGWLALAALGAIIIAGVLWGIWGSIPSKLVGQGILLRTGGLNIVAAGASGQVTALLVKIGDVVQAGQVVAEIQGIEGVTRTLVTSPYAGRVVEIPVDDGGLVERGTRLLSLVDESRPLEAVVYLTPTDGKRVAAGMSVQISPSTVPQEQFGFMRGTVLSVGEFPSTYEGMFRVLKNDDLVRALRVDGAPIEVRVSLAADPDAPSGYQWSSPQGPPNKVENGTPASAFITVGQQRPITLVLPFVK